MRVLIVGAGGHAQVVADSLLLAQSRPGAAQPVGFVDDDLALHGRCFLGLPVLGRLSDLAAIVHDGVVVGIGHNPTRRSVFLQLMQAGEHFVTVTHPSAVVSPFASIGPGTVVCAGAIVNAGASVGENVILNTASTVDHHCQLGAHSHVAPGAHLAGEVRLGEGVLVGVGAVIRPRQAAGAWSVIGAGAVVVNDIPAQVTVVGVPARPQFSDKAE